MASALIPFGKYQLLSRLAAGGMAEIFLARTNSVEGFEKYLVIKRMLGSRTSDPEFVTMFLEEARLAATLDHPNVIHIYDVGNVDGEYFIAMEYLRGRNLLEIMRTSIRQGHPRLRPELAISIMANVCAGLHYAHEKRDYQGRPLGIVHRDVTPHNILVTFEGAVKVVDFGIAKVATREVETRAGTLKGKIGYMAPEQCTGGTIDRRTDIFAMGVVLYEITLGQRLYQERSDFETLKKIVEGPVPDPRAVLPSYPSELAAIVMRCLEKQPSDRYQTARELHADLERFGRAHHLETGTVALAQYMELLYGEELAGRSPTSTAEFAAVSSTSTDSGLSYTARGETWSRSSVTATPLGTVRREHLMTRLLQGTVVLLLLVLVAIMSGGFLWWRNQRRPPMAPVAIANASLGPTGGAPALGAAALPAARTTAQTAAPLGPGLAPARPRPAAKPGDAHLTVASDPRCEVLVDGVPYGATPIIDLAVTAGKHTITLLNSAAGIREQQRVQLQPNELWTRSFRWSGGQLSTSKSLSPEMLALAPAAAPASAVAAPATPAPAAATAGSAAAPSLEPPAAPAPRQATVEKTPAPAAPTVAGAPPEAPAPPAQPAAPRNVRAQDLEGQALDHPDPHLPPSFRVQHRGQGELPFAAKVCLGTDGKVHQVKILRGIPGADEAIVQTIMKWTYKPQPEPVCFVSNILFDVR